MDERTRTYGSLGLAIAMIVTGTLATGFLPSTPVYQFVAGAIIVAGFAVGYVGIGAIKLVE